MESETTEFLDRVACIAQANSNYHASIPEDVERTADEEGARYLMGAYLELYNEWNSDHQSTYQPSEFAFAAAGACCKMRREMERRPKVLWTDEEHALFTLMLAFMFLFKHLYVVKG